MKTSLCRFFGKLRGLPSHKQKAGTSPAEGGKIELEQLEPRMLFSAAPVEAPDNSNPEPEQVQESVVVTQQAAQVAAISLEATELEDDPDGTLASEMSIRQAEADTALTLAQTEISKNQNVTLVNIDGISEGLNQSTLDAVADAAAQRWVDSGQLSEAQITALGNINYTIDNLPAARLGSVNGNTISVDGDAWGKGWFIDATPNDDSEFGITLSSGALSASGNLGGRFDLLTVVLHEQGHILGLTDLLSAGSASGNVMSTSISAESRLLPAFGQAAGATPGSITNAEFATMTFQVLNLNDSGPDSLRQAILNANANSGADFIEFVGGGIGTISLTGAQLTINDDVTINSTAAAGVVVDMTALNERVFEVQGSKVTFDTLTISGAQNNAAGGGVLINGAANVTFDTVLLTNNSATEGGGFYVTGSQGATVTLIDSDLIGNKATTRGGGFRNSGVDTTVTMTNGTISGNTATNEHGGAFYNNGTVILDNTVVSGNFALDMDNANRNSAVGGGFYNSGNVTLKNGSNVVNNDVWGTGGGFYNTGGLVEATGSLIDGNELFYVASTAPNGGGFANVGDGIVNLTDVILSNNATGMDGASNTQGNGGGFYNADGTVTVTGISRLTGNRAATGGGFYNTSTGSTVNIKGTALNPIEIGGSAANGNTARSVGGGFRSTSNTEVNLEYVDVTYNSTDDAQGGGIYADGPTVTGNNVRINNNKTGTNGSDNDNEQGGGFYLTGDGTVTLTDSQINDNESRFHGGGFNIASGSVNLTKVSVDGNYSENTGGGFWAENSARVNLADVSISRNTAGDTSGAGYIEDDAAVVGVRVNVDENLAGYLPDRMTQDAGTQVGGAFYLRYRGSLLLTDSTIDRNESTYRGGAIYMIEDTLVDLRRVSVSENVARDSGGAVWVNNANSTLRMTNSTISGNAAGFTKADSGGVLTVAQPSEPGGAIYQNQGLIELNHVTVTQNQATNSNAGGLYSANRTGREGFYLENSIVFNNFDNADTAPGASFEDITNRVTLIGANVIGVHAGTALDGNTPPITVDPGLGLLADNGGVILPDGNAVRTHAITGASSAAGQSIASSVAIDQRGEGRPGVLADLGAFEADPLATTLMIDKVIMPENALSGVAFNAEVVVTSSAAGPLSVTWSIDAPVGGQLGTGVGVSTSLTATNPLTDPIQTVVVSVTVTDTVSGQSATEKRNIVLVDPLAMPTVGAAGSIIVDTDVDEDNGAGVGAGTSLREAIKEANSSGAGTFVITFAAGVNPTLSTSVGIVTDENGASNGDLDITKTNGVLSIVGNAGPNTIIDADGIDRVFDVRPGASVYFSNLEITGGETTFSDHGAGLRILGATAVFKDVDIIGNDAIRGADNVGGGVYTTSSGVLASQVYMTRGSVANNVADSHGGGFYMAGTNVGKGFLYLTDTVVDGNVASYSGGIRVDRDGGGFYITDDGNRVVLNNVTVSNNRTEGVGGINGAGADGGGALFTGADNVIEINGGAWFGNIAGRNALTGGTGDNDGGGFMVEGTRQTITLNGVTIGGELLGGADAAGLGTARGTGNQAEDDGGAFYMQGQHNTVNLIDTLIVGNQANDTGGGFFVATRTETVNISQTKVDGGGIRNNFSETEHGGGFRNDGNVNITGSAAAPFEIRYNEARGSVGGGFYNTANGTTTLTDVVIRNNEALNFGGGYYNSGGGNVVITSSAASKSGVASSFVSKIIDNKVTNTNLGADGGGFYQATANSLSELTNVLISGNTATDEGAGFINESNFSTVKLTNVDLTGNEALDQGGGFYNRSTLSAVELNNVLIDGNRTTTEHGGGFRNIGIVTGTNVTITNNKAGFDLNNVSKSTGDLVGGGFYNSSLGQVILVDATIEDNIARGRGGGFYNTSIGSLVDISSSIIQSSISNNSVFANRNEGGGFWNGGGATVIVKDTVVAGNSSGVEGGGFYQEASNSRVELTDVILDKNTSASGGGFYNISTGGVVTLQNVQITNNDATSSHGGGFRNVGTVTGSNVVITGNRALGSGTDDRVGGGFYNNGGAAEVTLTNFDISNNFANMRGGGVFNNGAGQVSLTNGTISNNISGERGGGFYQETDNSTSSLTNVTISGNRAGRTEAEAFKILGNGGGLYNTSVSTLTLNHVTIANNDATGSGGGIQRDGGAVTLVNSIVAGNREDSDGANIGNDVSGAIDGAETNLVEIGAVTGGATITTNPGLKPLANNGGTILTAGLPAFTHALDLGASDASDAATGSILTEDQRGILRPVGAANDLGAFEGPGTLYVNDQWAALSPTDEVDGNLELAGAQTALVGVDAFGSIADALAKYTSYSGNIIVNGGTYATADLAAATGDINLQLVQDLADSELDVTIVTLTGDASDSIETRFYGTAEADLIVGDGTFAGSVFGIGSLTKNTAGTLTLTGTNNYTGTTDVAAGSLVVDGGSISATDSVNLGGGTLQVINAGNVGVTNGVTNGAGAGSLLVDVGSVTVGNGLDIDTLRVGYNLGTGTLTVSGGAVVIGNGTGTFDIGRRESGDGPTLGTVDFAAATSVAIDVQSLRMGTDSTGGNSVQGDLTLSVAGTNTLTTGLIQMGFDNAGGNQSTSVSSDLHLGGGDNFVNATTWTVGDAKSVGMVDIVSGGALTLRGQAGGSTRTDLNIGFNTSGTGTTPATSDFNLTGAAGLDLLIGDLIIGRHLSSSGLGSGRLTFGSGTIDANTVTLGLSTGSNPLNTTGTINQNGGAFTVNNGMTDGGGSTTLNVNAGTFTVSTGGFQVDDLLVGQNSTTATLTVNGGAVVVGDGGGNFDIGRSAGVNTIGTVDFSNASSVMIDVVNLRHGTNASGSNRALGDLTLSAAGTNTVNATNYLMGYTEGGANYGAGISSDLHLGGAANNFNIDTFTVGGRKSSATVDIIAGGTLTLSGDANTEADLLIGNNDSTGTGTAPSSSVNLTGGTFNATLNNLTVGLHGGGGGSGDGSLTFEAGTVTVNAIVLADTDAGGTSTADANTDGILNFDGDILNLQGGDIIDGGGTPTFTFTGGTLKDVNVFGLALVQQGGTLQIGADGAADNMAVTGDYSVTGTGNFNVDIAGTAAGTAGGHDQLDVGGTVDLGSGIATLNLAGAHVASIGESFIIIDNDGTTDLTTGFFSGLMEGSMVMFNGKQLFITYNGGDGNDVVLNTTPEINGTGANDILTVEVQANGDLQYVLNGGPVITATAPTAFGFNGGDGDDHFQLNTNGNDIPLGGITFHGMGQSNVGNPTPLNGDVLSIDGVDHTQTATYTPSATTQGDGTVDIDGRTITFTGLEPVDISGMLLATLSLPGGNDVITLTNGFDAGTGLIDAIVATGTSGGVAIESAHFFNNTTVRVDTSLVTDGNDTVTVASASNAHANENLIINTGTGTDTVTVSGAATFAGDITITTPDTTINGALTSSGNGTIGIESDTVTIGAAVNAGTGRVEIDPLTAGTNIHFGNTILAGELNLSDTEIDRITAGVLQVGDSTAGRILFSGTSNGGLITPANVSTVHLITDQFVDDSADSNLGGGIRVANLAIEVGGTALSGVSNAVVLTNANSGVRSDVETLAIHSANGRILYTDYSHGIGVAGLTIGTVDGLSGIINNTNDPGTATADNDRERIDIHATVGNLAVIDTPDAVEVFSRRDSLLRASGDQQSIFINTGVVMTMVEGGVQQLRADNIVLEGTINSPGRTVQLHADDIDNQIHLGTGATDVFGDDILEIDQAELDRITATNVQIGRHNYTTTDGVGAITVVGTTSLANAAGLRLTTNATVSQNAGATINVTNLGINARGDVILTENNIITGVAAIDLQTGNAGVSGMIDFVNNDVDWTIDSAAGTGNFMRTDNGDITVASSGIVRVDESATNADVEVRALTMGIGNGNITFNIGAGTTNGADFITNEATDSNNDQVDIFAAGNLAINLLGTGDSRIIINDATNIDAGGNIVFDVLGSNNNAQIILHGGTSVDAGGDITFTLRSNNGQFITNFDDSNPVAITSTSGTLTIDVDRWLVDANTVINIAGQQMFVTPFATGDGIILGVTADTADGILRISNDELNTIGGLLGTLTIGEMGSDISVGGGIDLPVDVVFGNEGGAVNVSSTIDGAQSLNFGNTDGTTTIGANIGSGTALTSLTTDATGLTVLNNGVSISTLGDQTYNDQLDVAGAGATGQATLNAGGGLVFNTTTLFSVDLLNSSPGTGHDQLVVNGTVTLNNADLDLNPLAGLTPNPGDQFILISNDGADAVNGTFNGLAEGNIISLNLGGVASALFQISYQGGTLNNDVVLTALGVSATTDITLEETAPGSGIFNLVINDIDEGVSGGGSTGNSTDEWNITVDGSDVVITSNGALGTLINGATQQSLNEVRIDASLFSGDVIVNGLTGNDFITIGDLGNLILPMGLSVNGGDGFDNIRYTGDGSVLNSGGSATFNAEEIDFFFSDLSTTDGSITLNGTGGIAAGGGTFQGIHLQGSSLDAGGTGSITLNGSGGDSGNHNQGVLLTQDSSLSTNDGNIDIDGAGGGAVAGKGVMIYSGSSIAAGGSGNLTIDGTGAAGGTVQNEGVFFTAASASVEDGAMTITGTGGGSLGYGTGVSITRTTLEALGTGTVAITGTSAATGGTGNGGVSLNVVTLTTAGGAGTGEGSVTLNGSGSAAGTTNNVGVKLNDTDITAGADGSIDIDGTGTGTAAGNTGVLLNADSNLTVGGTGAITLDGSGSATGTSNNDGIQLSPLSNLTVADGALTLRGTGAGGSGGNSEGVTASGATLTGTGTGNISITGSSTSAGSSNRGISLTNTAVTTAASGSGSITLNGTGSAAGLSNNEGVRLSNSDLSTGANGSIDIDGLGGGTALGANNSGVSFLTGSTAVAGGGGTLTIDGTGGNSANFNRGVYVTGAGSSLSTVNGNLTVRGNGNGSASFNRGVELVYTTVSSTGSGAVTLLGTGSQAASGSQNTGVYLQASNVSAASGGITLTGSGGTGSTLNEGVRVVGGALSGALNLTGTASGSTSGNSNTGVYILNANLGGIGGGTITGSGGGLTSGAGNYNHGIYMQGIVGYGGGTSGTKGFGAASLDETGNFPF